MAERVNITRRGILKSAPAATMLAAAPPALALEPESEIMQLFREWKRLCYSMNGMSDDESDAACKVLHSLEERMISIPASTAAEVAAKIITTTCEGVFGVQNHVILEMWALTGVSVPRGSHVLDDQAGAV